MNMMKMMMNFIFSFPEHASIRFALPLHVISRFSAMSQSERAMHLSETQRFT
jgi:hypothetical protein